MDCIIRTSFAEQLDLEQPWILVVLFEDRVIRQRQLLGERVTQRGKSVM